MASGQTKTSIISAAFFLLRGRIVNDLTVDDPTIQGADKLYDIHLRYILTCYPWRFAMITRELNKLAGDSPVERYPIVFQLPGDLLRIQRTEPIVNYEIFEDKLYTNIDSLKLEYIAEVDTSKFAPYFIDFLVESLAAKLAMPVTQDINLERVFQQRADRLMLLAKSIDSQIQPNIPIRHDPLLRAKLGNIGRGFI